MVASTRVVDADAASQLVLGYAFRASDDPERGAWRFGIAAGGHLSASRGDLRLELWAERAAIGSETRAWRLHWALDDDERLHGQEIAGLRVHPPSTLDLLAEQYDVEELLIAIPSANSKEMRRIVDLCNEADVPLRTLPRYQDLVDGRSVGHVSQGRSDHARLARVGAR